jgi:hypothetical protein
MKSLALFLALCLGMASLAHSGELSDAAKGAKAKRKKSTSKVIRNADVKRSKGQIATTNAPTTPVEKEPTLAEKHAASRAADKVATARRLKAEQLVADLEKEVAALERAYFDDNDLNRRDTVTVPRFNDAKARLDAARADLSQLP